MKDLDGYPLNGGPRDYGIPVMELNHERLYSMILSMNDSPGEYDGYTG
jgi:hypothetical protein